MWSRGENGFRSALLEMLRERFEHHVDLVKRTVARDGDEEDACDRFGTHPVIVRLLVLGDPEDGPARLDRAHGRELAYPVTFQYDVQELLLLIFPDGQSEKEAEESVCLVGVRGTRPLLHDDRKETCFSSSEASSRSSSFPSAASPTIRPSSPRCGCASS